MSQRVVLYARLSVSSSEESVSIERQLERGRFYCQAKGWRVMAEYVDDGVSADKVKPENRPGWRGVLDHAEPFDVALVWKVDRLARKVLDFLRADEALQARGAAVAAVDDPVDMSTAQGRAFAVMLAVFGEMEAEAIRARVKGAREVIVKAGRTAGGRPTYGWQNVPNSNGAGKVVAQDPDTVAYVSGAVAKVLAGESVYSVTKWLDDVGAPIRQSRKQKRPNWSEGSVEKILRAPVLAGLTAYQPGRKPGEAADPYAVLRDADGLPVINEDVAVISTDERRQLLAILDGRKGHRRQVDSAGLLSQMLTCDTCRKTLHRNGGGAVYQCRNKACAKRAGGNRAALEAHVVAEFLAECGDAPVLEMTEAPATDSADVLKAIESAIRDAAEAMGRRGADRVALLERLDHLEADRDRLESNAPTITFRKYPDETVAARWESLEGDETGRREFLGRYLQEARVAPGTRPVALSDRVFLTWGAPVDMPTYAAWLTAPQVVLAGTAPAGGSE